MAREPYCGSPPPDSPYYEYQDPRASQSSSDQPNHPRQTQPDQERQRPREMSSGSTTSYTSDAGRYQQTQQPMVNNAVNSAVHSANASTAIPADILNQLTHQITANVIDQLKSINLGPTLNTSPPPVYASMSTPYPAPGSSPKATNNAYGPPSPRQGPQMSHSPPPMSATHLRFGDIPPSQSSPPSDQYPTSPTIKVDEAVEDDDRDGPYSRPKGPTRLSTGQDVTILEKMWGTLFNVDGSSTPRLGQFLRGIAVHMIEDYEPTNSLVVTPDKMQRYYEKTKLPTELYPWQIVFDDHTSSISRLFREIEVQHHLVQGNLAERPDTPGLTPLGFERWVTLLLRAHPDQEYERLVKTAVDMPISNPDDRKERFPKGLSRRLFPEHTDEDIRKKLEKAMATHCNIRFPSRQDSISDSGRRTSDVPQQPDMIVQPGSSYGARDGGFLSPTTSRQNELFPLGFDRGRKPHSTTPSEAPPEDDRDDEAATPRPFERERKPYVAQPGGGKNYEDVNRQPSPPDFIAPPPHRRPARSGSMASHGRPAELPKSRPISIHQPSAAAPIDPASPAEPRASSQYRTNSIPHGQSQPSALDNRNRSPSRNANGRTYGHASDSIITYGSVESSGSRDANENDRRNRDYEREREKYTSDRYDPSRIKAYDPREREREPRRRSQTSASLEGQPPYVIDDDYFRTSAGGHQPPPEGLQYPYR
jgi:hypothetical protein